MDTIDKAHLNAEFETRWSVNKIKEANRATGSHWFDPGTMRTFGTIIERTVYQGIGGVYFVTSDDNFDRTARQWSVRKFNPEDGGVVTASEFGEFSCKGDAVERAKELAGEGYSQKTESYRPISVLEQFVYDLRKHGNADAHEADAKQLMKLAAKHHKYMEMYCNGQIETDEEGEFPTYVRTLKAEIAVLAMDVGAKVVFSGDPRGATVKLVFPNGETNDWGKEGWVVPTGEDE